MKIFISIIMCFSWLVLSAVAEVPTLTLPEAVEVYGNGLNSLAFVVKQSAVSPEVERSLRFLIKGAPANNPPVFDASSKLFFWRPEPNQVGQHTFTLVAKDPLGVQSSGSVRINVLAAASPEALPKGWQDFKLAEKYLVGRKYLPSSNYLQADIAARPEYEIEVLVKDSLDENCLLTYLPKEGRNQVNKTQKTATIMLGGQYASDSIKTIRRDLYEDLFNTLDLVFKQVESVKIKGDYLLKDFCLSNKLALISAAGVDEIYVPKLNIAFDDRYYEATLYSQKEPMMISDIPEIKVDLNTSSGVIWRRARLFINEAEYSAAWGDFSVVVAKPYKDASSFDVDYAMYVLKMSAAKKLPFGEHHLIFEVENAYGQLLSLEAYARVVTVPTQLEGAPMVFPSPFNPARDSEVKIQYRLSLQSNIEVVIFGGDGSTVMKQRYSTGDEGGKKGLNTIVWSGKTDANMTVSNGIYIGVIIDRDENRILDKFRLTVFR
ncbi:MAG: hypothetical protein ABID35_00385 [Candidatus Margulisiibacteriota bacterium]